MSSPEGPVAVIDIGSNSGRVVVYRLEARPLDADPRQQPRLAAAGARPRRDPHAEPRGASTAPSTSSTTSAASPSEPAPRKSLPWPPPPCATPKTAQAFIAEIQKRFGFEVRILERRGGGALRLPRSGAAALPVEDGVLFDLGGGSMQVTRFRAAAARERRGACRSARCGCPTPSWQSDPPELAGSSGGSATHVRRVLEKAKLAPAAEPGETLVGTGGTVRNLAKIDLRSRELPDQPPSRLRARRASASKTSWASWPAAS